MEKSNFKQKKYLLQYLRSQKGFTLIELIVVVIILGVLAAVAVPNFLKQVGKAREVEFQKTLGTINRAQQSFHFENQVFAQGSDDNESLLFLGISIDAKYIDNNGYNIVANTNSATTYFINSEYEVDGTRAYSGGMFYNSTNGTYNGTSCRSLDIIDQIAPPSAVDNCGTNILLE